MNKKKLILIAVGIGLLALYLYRRNKKRNLALSGASETDSVVIIDERPEAIISGDTIAISGVNKRKL